MRRLARSFAVGMCAAVVLVMMQPDRADAYVKDGAKWTSSPKFSLWGCSVNPNWASGDDIKKAATHWNWVYGMWDIFSFRQIRCPSDLKIRHGDGRNDVAMAWIQNQETKQVGAYTWSLRTRGNSKIKEADIMFSAYQEQDGDFAFGSVGLRSCGKLQAGFEFPFRGVAVHEFGHAMGLGHPSGSGTVAFMTNSFAYSFFKFGRYCAFRGTLPHPDDAAGGRDLYTSGNTSYEVGVGSFYGSGYGGGVIHIEPSDDWVCPGDTVKASVTWSNRGNGSNSGEVSLRWSENRWISRHDKKMGSRTFSSNGYEISNYSNRIQFTVPSTADYDSEYWVGSRIESLNNKQSWNYETNNRARYVISIETKPKSDC